jgi:hypothetical protein
MPRAKKTPSEMKPKTESATKPAAGEMPEQPKTVSKAGSEWGAANKTVEATGKPVSSVNQEGVKAGVKSNGKISSDLEAAIRERAYQYYLERGRTDGHAHEDWARAEQEILGDRTKRTA